MLTPYTQSTGAAVSLDAVLVEMQTQSTFLSMIFWVMCGFAFCLLLFIVWKFFEKMFFQHMK